MKIVFIGSVLFSAKALEKLIQLNAEIIGIVTKQEAILNSDFYDLSPIAINNKIQWCYTSDINSNETVNWIKQLNPDIIFCFGWSNLIKKEILQIPKLGVIGFHPTMLPYNKGRHPLIWAKVLGLKKSGSTFFFMDEGADTGDILSQKEFEINFEDDALNIYNKLTEIALIQIEEFYYLLKNKTYSKISQDKTIGNTWRKRSIKDGVIDFRMSSTSICNLVRALSKPYIGAHLEYKNQNITVWAVEPDYDEINLEYIEHGKVLNIIDNKIKIKTGDSSIWITKHEFFELPQIGSYI